MIRADEVRQGDGQLQFSLSALDARRLRSRVQARNTSMAAAEQAANPYQLNLSGPKILVGVTFALCVMTLCAWFVRLWLQAP